jgi:hypothetical protein
MVRRGGKKRAPRRRKSFSLVNAVFSVGYGSIITEGLFKTSLPEFVLGDMGIAGITSGGGISLKELISRPELIQQAGSNAFANLPMMVVQSLGLSIVERIFKKTMSMPLRRVNAGLVKPVLGAGIKL